MMVSQIVLRLISISLGAVWLCSVQLYAAPAYAAPAYAAPAQFALAQHKVTGTRTSFRIYNVKTGNTVWHWTINGQITATWTPDHRAVTIIEYSNELASWTRLLIWEAGKKVQELTELKVPLRQLHGDIFRRDDGDLLSAESFQEAVLSPNKKRLFIRAAESSNGSDWGELWCLNFARYHFQRISWGVSEAHWVGNRRVEFKEVHIVQREHPNQPDQIIITYPQATVTVK